MARQLVISNQIGAKNATINRTNGMQDFADAIGAGIAKANANVYNLMAPGAAPYDKQPNPPSMNFTISSTKKTGSESKTAYIFNEDVFNENLTDNGGGANTIVTTYGDGFSGHWYNQAMKTYNKGKGIFIYGWTVQAFNITSGNQDPTVYSTLNFTWTPYNGYGLPLSETQDFNQAIRNTQFQDGIFTLGWQGYLASIGQFTFVMPVDTKLVFTFLNKPIVSM